MIQRQKIVRKIHALDRELEESERKVSTCTSSSVTSARKAMDSMKETRSQLVSDLVYTLYFPNQLKYVSLFASNDGKSEINMTKARTLALAEWERTKTDGSGDRVEHVLAGKPMADEGKSDVNEHENIVIETKTRKTTPEKNQRLTKPHVLITDESNKKRSRKKEDSDSFDKVNDKNKKQKLTELASEPPLALSEGRAAEVDSFFLEGSTSGSEHPPAYHAVSTKNTVHRKNFSNPQDINQNRPFKTSQHFKRNGANGAPLHKQELRLQKWQAKQSH